MATSSFYTSPKSTTTTTATACNCPACRGLECLERPRFFAGQLLTEAELNSEQAYLLAKNRLHNRYLHGSGVVCGLEVVCHQCDGFVRVKSGYALDPCGNDVIVCKDVDFNVIDAIQKCVDARRRRATEDCPPWRDPNDTCVDDEVHWCIALEYVENETRGVMPLQNKPKSGGCGCGGSTAKTGTSSGGGCGCQTKSAPTPARPAACEATRVLEQYRLSVIPEPASCTEARTLDQILARLSGTVADFPPRGSFIGALLPAGLESNKLLQALVAAAPSASLLGRVLAISEKIEAFFATRFSDATERNTLIRNLVTCLAETRQTVGAGTTAPAGGVGGWMYLNLMNGVRVWTGGSSVDQPLTVGLCCRFRRAVRDLYAQNPFNVRCEPFICPPCEIKSTTTGTTTPPVPPTSTVPPTTTIPPTSTVPPVTTVPPTTVPPTTASPVTNTGLVPPANTARAGTAALPGGGTILTGNSTLPVTEILRFDDHGNPVTTNNDAPLIQLTESFCCVARAFVDYVVDAICTAINPPCPPDPAEDRLIIACVTIKDNHIIDICNHSCRRYAGSFPALEYWTSAVPIVPLIQRLLRGLCCASSAVPIIAQVSAALHTAKINPAQTQPTAPTQPINPNTTTPIP